MLVDIVSVLIVVLGKVFEEFDAFSSSTFKRDLWIVFMFWIVTLNFDLLIVE